MIRRSISLFIITWIVASCAVITPQRMLEQQLQKAKTYEESSQWEALEAVTREATLLLADHPELSDQAYQVSYYQTKGYIRKAKQTQSLSDLMMAIEAGKKAVSAALPMNQAGKIRAEELGQVVQVLLDAIMMGVDIALNVKEFQTAASLIEELQQFSEQTRIFPSDLTPIFKAAELFYVTAQRMITGVDVPDNQTQQKVSELVNEGNDLFSWASAHDEVKQRATIHCIRLNAYWSVTHYYEVCEDPLLITPKTSTQITAKELVANPQLMDQALIYLDATQAQVEQETRLSHSHRVLIHTHFGPFYLRSSETIDLPGVIFGRFTNIAELRDRNVVQKVPELEVIVLKAKTRS